MCWQPIVIWLSLGYLCAYFLTHYRSQTAIQIILIKSSICSIRQASRLNGWLSTRVMPVSQSYKPVSNRFCCFFSGSKIAFVTRTWPRPSTLKPRPETTKPTTSMPSYSFSVKSRHRLQKIRSRNWKTSVPNHAFRSLHLFVFAKLFLFCNGSIFGHARYPNSKLFTG